MKTKVAKLALAKQDALMLLVAIFWGLTFLFTKLGLKSFDPVTFATLRTISAAIALNILGVLHIRTKGACRFRIQDHILALFLGLLGMAFFPWTFSLAMQATSSANGGLIFGTTPVVVGLISIILGMDRSSPGNWVGVMLSFIGILLIINPKEISFSSNTFTGDLLMTGAMFTWAVYTVANRLAPTRISPLQLTAYASLWGTSAIIAISLPELSQQSWGKVLPVSWLGAILSGVLATALSYVLWNKNVKQVGPTKTAVYLNLVPLVAIISGYLILGEALYWYHLPAGLAILSGVLFTKLDQHYHKPTSPGKLPTGQIKH